jgi:hypothetical protein
VIEQKRHEQPRLRPLDAVLRPPVHRDGFDESVEELVVLLEEVIVTQVAFPDRVEDVEDEPGMCAT